MSETVHTGSTTNIEQLADEIIAERRPRRRKQQSYRGTKANSSRRRGYDYIRIGGGMARLLTEQEIDQLQGVVARGIAGDLVQEPIRLKVPA